MKKTGLLFSIVLLLTSCPMDYEHRIGVKNNSNQIIVVTGKHILPDTILPETPNELITININAEQTIAGSRVGDKDLRRMDRGEKLTLFVLSKDSVISYPWEYIRKNNVILKRYEFDFQEFNKIGWITYP